LQGWPSWDESSGTHGDAQVDPIPVEHPYVGRLAKRSTIWKQAKAAAKERMGGIADLDLD